MSVTHTLSQSDHCLWVQPLFPWPPPCPTQAACCSLLPMLWTASVPSLMLLPLPRMLLLLLNLSTLWITSTSPLSPSSVVSSKASSWDRPSDRRWHSISLSAELSPMDDERETLQPVFLRGWMDKFPAQRERRCGAAEPQVDCWSEDLSSGSHAAVCRLSDPRQITYPQDWDSLSVKWGWCSNLACQVYEIKNRMRNINFKLWCRIGRDYKSHKTIWH